MTKATRRDKSQVITLLKNSFIDNRSVNYIIKQDRHREERILALMDYSFEMCLRFGEVWVSEDRSAAALVLYPQNKHLSICSVWLDVKLIFQAIGIAGITRALERETRIKAKQPKEPMTYLWFIGVDPSYQHQGIGGRLLSDIITLSDEMNLSVYLETSTLKNLPWYERFSFYRYDQLELDYTIYFFKRDPDK
jgi:ribosomal protein S18 acetylase RimI-like enzyme